MIACFPSRSTNWPPSPPSQYREKTVGQRMKQTIVSATGEHTKATQKAMWTGRVQGTAMALQILIGALTTGLGAALSGKSTSVAISILGGASTLVASYLARTKSSNQPQASRLRAQALDHFLREINAFVLDHGHEVGGKWDEKINGFRLGLERILGNHPGSLTVGPDRSNSGREKGIGDVDPGAGLGGSG
ncbi:hypothetical protein BC826DRAFT_918505 [Russula brevipes]|nr:hypothetical protein BC826DRAFT_918505 [Russula brevipes]